MKIFIIACLVLVLVSLLKISTHVQYDNSAHLPSFTQPLVSRIGWPTVLPSIVHGTPSEQEMFSYKDPALVVHDNSIDTLSILATGDVIPARSVNARVTALDDFLYPFRKTADFLSKHDIVLINLETPLIKNCPVTIEGMSFCGDNRSIDGLVYAGVDVASIANNHAGNYGLSAINETIQLLQSHQIEVIGNGEAAMLERKGKIIGFLGYNDIGSPEEGISWADIQTMTREINELKKHTDIVIVTFHWGIEYVLDPSDRQRELGHAAVDAGADLIIGNHPHWVQGVELYKGKYISYAHGNFVFDQMWSQETREGVLGRYIFKGNNLVSVHYIPIIIEDYVQPRFAGPDEAEKVLSRMKDSSRRLSTSN